MSLARFYIHGPAVIDRKNASLVLNAPRDSAERIAAALNAAYTADLHWAVPEVDALQPGEHERVIRALAMRARGEA